MQPGAFETLEVRRRAGWSGPTLAATGDLAAVLAMPACLAGAAAVATALPWATQYKKRS